MHVKRAELPLPEIGLFAATRGMLGAGIALLIGDRLDKERRKTVGWTLLLLGAASTVPFVIDIWSKRQ